MKIKHLLLVGLLFTLLFGGVSCKSKKKVSDISDPNQSTEQNTATEEQANANDNQEQMASEGLKMTVRNKEEASEREKVSTKLSSYFAAIANASSVFSANRTIQEALTLFAAPDALVLIIINESNGKKDYDRPTDISEYLNYLKDQKKNPNKIDTFKLNADGKITELELIKK